ncbi:hypothetical protein, partial [Endozoicomonas sp. ALB115]|uniref:hypothetical protein n=1 Tax=Endozoicomonas sp. ALB115 TaxID=3403074 RepID=UPI003BB59E80
ILERVSRTRVTVIEKDCVAGWKRVAGCYRNGWPDVTGMGGRMLPEWVAECFRNTQSSSFSYGTAA